MHSTTASAIRASGLLPLTFLAATALEHREVGDLYALLWICNVANALVAIGLLTRRANVALFGTTWIAWGSVWWFLDALAFGGIALLPALKHWATTAVGVVAVLGSAEAALERSRPRLFLRSAAAFCLLQAICRVTTPGLANVNFAFESYHAVASWFPPGTYTPFWIALVASGAAFAYVFELALLRLRAFAGALRRVPAAKVTATGLAARRAQRRGLPA